MKRFEPSLPSQSWVGETTKRVPGAVDTREHNILDPPWKGPTPKARGSQQREVWETGENRNRERGTISGRGEPPYQGTRRWAEPHPSLLKPVKSTPRENASMWVSDSQSRTALIPDHGRGEPAPAQSEAGGERKGRRKSQKNKALSLFPLQVPQAGLELLNWKKT